jgi:hypothetical protein
MRGHRQYRLQRAQSRQHWIVAWLGARTDRSFRNCPGNTTAPIFFKLRDTRIFIIGYYTIEVCIFLELNRKKADQKFDFVLLPSHRLVYGLLAA